MRISFSRWCSVALLLVLAGCDGPEQSGLRAARLAQSQAILREPPGDYYVGRRYYNPNYKFWGYVRKPGQQWREAKLVMLNENGRSWRPTANRISSAWTTTSSTTCTGISPDQTVYEPASNRFYPEFMLTGWEIADKTPPSIFPPNSGASDDHHLDLPAELNG